MHELFFQKLQICAKYFQILKFGESGWIYAEPGNRRVLGNFRMGILNDTSASASILRSELMSF